MELLNCIADALNSVIPDGNFVVYVSHLRDHKFPVYVTHKIELVDCASKLVLRKERRVHSGQTALNKEMRRLVTELLSAVISAAAEGGFADEQSELRCGFERR